MSKPYTPQPGTIPHRVVKYLRRMQPGECIATAPLADELDVSPSSILPCMGAAVRGGLVKRESINGLVHWSLGDGTPPPADTDAEDDPEMKSKIVITPAASAAKAAPAHKPQERQKAPDKTNPLRTEKLDAPEIQIQLDLPAPEPVFGAFSDGSLSIEHGDTFLRLGEKQAKALQAFMCKAWSRG